MGILKTIFKKELLKLFPKAQLYEVYESKQTAKKYQVLLRITPQDKVQWLEVTENTHSLYDKYFRFEEELSGLTRLEMAKNTTYSDKVSNSIFNILINKRFFTVKFVENFSSEYKFDEIPYEEYHGIILDQAYVLGRLHSLSLKNNIDDYIKAWAQIPSSDIDEKTIAIKFKLID